MPKNMPEIEIDATTTAPQQFRSVRHARRVDQTRGVEIDTATGPFTATAFMDYTEAVRLHEALGAALAFLDADGE
jgi:hypothetical protein